MHYVRFGGEYGDARGYDSVVEKPMRPTTSSLLFVLLCGPFGCGVQMGDEGKLTCEQSASEPLLDLEVTPDEWTGTVAERLASDTPGADGTLTLGSDSTALIQSLTLDEDVRRHLEGSCSNVVSVTGTVSVAAPPLVEFEAAIVLALYPDRTSWSVDWDREAGAAILPPRTFDPAAAPDTGLSSDATLSGQVWTGSLRWTGQVDGVENVEDAATWEAVPGA
jgi:hypothetical protein